MSLEERTAAERTYSCSSRESRQSRSSTGSFQSQSVSVTRDSDSNSSGQKAMAHINSLGLREVQDTLKDLEIMNQVSKKSWSHKPSGSAYSSSVLSTTSDSGVGDTLATSDLATPPSNIHAYLKRQNLLVRSMPERDRRAQAAAIALISNSQSVFIATLTPSRSSSPERVNGPNTPYLDPHKKQLQVQAFFAQKCYRARVMTSLRAMVVLVVMLLSIALSWVIGYLQYSYAYLVILVSVAVLVWWEHRKKIARVIEQEVEIRVRRKKSVQGSESAEWLNVLLNRWWATSSGAMIDFLQDYMEPLMQSIAPVGVEIVNVVEFDLANQTPVVKNVRVLDPSSSAPLRVSTGDNSTETHNPNQQVIPLHMDVGLRAPNSKLVLRARIGGKSIGYNTLVCIEGLNLSGSMQAVVTLDPEAPFPHIASLTVTFLRKPELWFDIKIFRGLTITEVPLLKNWIHSFITDVFTTLMVDPGKLSLNFLSSGPVGYSEGDSSTPARGVVTVTLRGSPPGSSSPHHDNRRWLTLRLGAQKYELHLPVVREEWRATYPFLVYTLQEEVLLMKIKHRHLLHSKTLALHSIAMATLQLDSGEGERSVNLQTSEANLTLDFHYTPLPPFSLLITTSLSSCPQVAGVLYVHVHSGSDLLSGDADGLSDPYCVVLANKKKVLTTHYILDTLNPNWEKGVEFFVTDFTQVSLAFAVYDWDGPLLGDDFLGMAKLNLARDEPEILQKKLDLLISGNSEKDKHTLGQITVSVVFRPVDSVARAELSSMPAMMAVPEAEGEVSEGEVTSSKNEVRRAAKLMRSKSSHYPYESSGMVELTVLQGRNLVAKDFNGLSDPYLVIKYGTEVMFRTRVVHKTLNPQWNESATLSSPHPDDTVRVECWDKDHFSDDFMGSIDFTQDDLANFQDGPKWCCLEHVKNGEVLLGIKKIVPKESLDWSHLDEASRPLVEAPLLEKLPDTPASSNSSVIGLEAIPQESDSQSDSGSAQLYVQQSSSSGSGGQVGSTSVASGRSTSAASGKSLSSIPEKQEKIPTPLRRRHTLAHTQSQPLFSDPLASRSHDDSSLSERSSKTSLSDTRTDVHRALRGGIDAMSLSHPRSSSTSTLGSRTRQTMYCNIAGQIMEADGLKGELDNLELYIKVRLNKQPSYQRQLRFGRGPVIHKTRVLRGSSNPQWREDFMVKESPVPSDSLLTVDLKSGSRINIGTHAITLDKFFDNNLKSTKWLDIGNDMRLRIRLTRQPTPDHSPILVHRLT